MKVEDGKTIVSWSLSLQGQNHQAEIKTLGG
jgi:hypothetical protein